MVLSDGGNDSGGDGSVGGSGGDESSEGGRVQGSVDILGGREEGW